VILWDIDGTLVSSRASRADKHVKAAEILLGRDLPNRGRTAGKTDRQILCELLEEHGTDPSPAALTAALSILADLSIEEISQFPVPTISGAVAALDTARSVGWINGLLTGNTPARARAKLESARIWGAFDLNFAYFGDVDSSRINLVGKSATAIRSEGVFEAVIVGDTPLDIQSAQEHGMRVIAVATGLYSAEELGYLNPDLLISDWESSSTSFVEFLTSACT
jgi:phosphoglycolate phosphatase-like HAD superfamily hydrolase